jgi:hypothetical protein
MIKYRINRKHTVRVTRPVFKKLFGGPHKLHLSKFVKTIGSGYRVIYVNIY